VTIYDALNRCESDAGAFEFVRPVQPLKHSKQFVCILHLKTHSIVPNEYYELIFVSVGASDLDFCSQARACEFDGIRNKVDQHNSQHRTVSVEIGQCPDLPHNVASLCILMNFR
jgi:hypothetical protein